MWIICVIYVLCYSGFGILITCWERAELLALVCDVELCFCHFPMWYPGSGVVLDCIDSRSLPPSLLWFDNFELNYSLFMTRNIKCGYSFSQLGQVEHFEFF